MEDKDAKDVFHVVALVMMSFQIMTVACVLAEGIRSVTTVTEVGKHNATFVLVVAILIARIVAVHELLSAKRVMEKLG